MKITEDKLKSIIREEIESMNNAEVTDVNEAKDDFVARYGSADITIKKGYKVASENELNDLYDAIGEVVNKLGFDVKAVTIVPKA